MRNFLILMIVLSSVSSAPKKKKIDYVDGVAVLTSDNFNDFIQSHKYVFVKFYAPWCGHCKQMAPGYARLAKQFQAESKNIVLAKVDSTLEGEISEEFEVRSYPTLKFFMHGEPIEYENDRNEKAIEEWINKQMNISIPVLESESEIQKIENSHIAVLLTCPSKNDPWISKLKILAANNDKIPFYVTHIPNAKDLFETRGNVNLVIFRDFDDKRKILSIGEDSTMNTVKEFFDLVKKPLILNLEDNAQEIFSKSLTTMIVFTNEKDSETLKILTEIANIRRNEMLFAYASISEGVGKKIAEHIGVTEEDQNAVRIIKFQGKDILKYKPDVVNKESLLKFMDNFKAGKLRPYLKSQPLPKNEKKAVKMIVADNFDDLVLKSNKHVFMVVHSPGCGHCEKMMPAWTKLASKLIKVPEMLIAKFDGVANEHPSLTIKGFPTVYLYKLRQKKKPIEYQGAKTFQAMVQFLEKELDRDLIFAEDMDLDDGL